MFKFQLWDCGEYVIRKYDYLLLVRDSLVQLYELVNKKNYVLQSGLFDLQISKFGEIIYFSLFCIILNLYVSVILLLVVVRQLNGVCYIFK